MNSGNYAAGPAGALQMPYSASARDGFRRLCPQFRLAAQRATLRAWGLGVNGPFRRCEGHYRRPTEGDSAIIIAMFYVNTTSTTQRLFAYMSNRLNAPNVGGSRCAE